MSDEGRARGRGFWIGLALGLPVVSYGLFGLVRALDGVPLWNWTRWFVGGALLHDLAVGPAVCLVGWGLARRLPAVAVIPVQVALLTSAFAGVVALPFVLGYGVTPGEPSFLSRDYGAALLGTWAAVWTVALAVVAVRSVTARRR